VVVDEADVKLLDYERKVEEHKRSDRSWLVGRAKSRSLVRSLSEAKRTEYTDFYVTGAEPQDFISKGDSSKCMSRVSMESKLGGA
jgi:hypothetical protein